MLVDYLGNLVKAALPDVPDESAVRALIVARADDASGGVASS